VRARASDEPLSPTGRREKVCEWGGGHGMQVRANRTSATPSRGGHSTVSVLAALPRLPPGLRESHCAVTRTCVAGGLLLLLLLDPSADHTNPFNANETSQPAVAVVLGLELAERGEGEADGKGEAVASASAPRL
jgi:hypothetical protein